MKINRTKTVGSIKLSRIEKIKANCKELQKDIMIQSDCKTKQQKTLLQKDIKENADKKQI